ncbi:MAG: hypothetical protein WD771_09195 [Gemmatimonadaceae bacterium]
MRPASLFLIPVIPALLAACERVTPPAPAPPAEFIVAAADSVFWIRSDDNGIRVRGAPMVLADIGGRFTELYVADDDHSFYDAVYVGQRLFKRDLINGDSMVLFADTLMRLLARSYAAANPDERPLSPIEQGSENPRTIASAEVLVLDVLGPWVSYEYRTDVDVVGGTSSHGARRGVLDLRSGVQSSLDALFGAPVARRVTMEASAEWRAIRDSLRRAADGNEEILAELDRLSFDPRSFILGVYDRAPRVRFTVVQSGSRYPGVSHELTPIPLEPPTWWDGVREGHPIEAELGERHWPHGEYTVVARPADGPTARVSFALRDAGGTEWRLGSVPAPVLRVMWADDSLVAPGTQAALTRAFNAAALYSSDTRIVSRPRTPPGALRLHLAASPGRVITTPRRIPPARPRN